MSKDTTLLIAKQKLMHRYRCTNCGNIHSNISDMVFYVIDNKVYCFECAGYSAPLQITPKPFAPSPTEADVHPKMANNEPVILHA